MRAGPPRAVTPVDGESKESRDRRRQLRPCHSVPSAGVGDLSTGAASVPARVQEKEALRDVGPRRRAPWGPRRARLPHARLVTTRLSLPSFREKRVGCQPFFFSLNIPKREYEKGEKPRGRAIWTIRATPTAGSPQRVLLGGNADLGSPP